MFSVLPEKFKITWDENIIVICFGNAFNHCKIGLYLYTA